MTVQADCQKVRQAAETTGCYAVVTHRWFCHLPPEIGIMLPESTCRTASNQKGIESKAGAALSCYTFSC